ncbi:GNAT family N-acetyltransferase [Celerinatantimonas yamalensis]|uniref:GNAT family N-acetyltransferase n=1 Tax=Celerinatantimonas yamalensis TaxID=559956 RepID=A0ABW9G3S3_9GAMM
MRIVEPTQINNDEYVKYIQACWDEQLEYYAFAIIDPNAFLETLIGHAKGLYLPEGWGAYSTYFCVSDGEIQGAIRVRHQSNDYIENEIGHIGYETRKTCRRKGVAKFLLMHVKQHVLNEPAYIICRADNIASRKVIESSGAQYIDSQGEGEHQRLRYQLN